MDKVLSFNIYIQAVIDGQFTEPSSVPNHDPPPSLYQDYIPPTHTTQPSTYSEQSPMSPAPSAQNND